ncbi:glutathionylspermidine synthase family protein [Peptoniphilus catoniae]|uniref:glutathionylspermidine synthase family protein n=1 Tax=Peptoniphilus catoniae TaxID=1660341 RepID=UPI0010FF296D|nr:glutathionylspermidine synthase family protein [Peptoniphilus catoniae]
MYNDKYVKDYFEIVNKNPKKYYNDYENIQKRVEKSFKDNQGHLVKYPYQGLFYSKEEVENFKSISKTLMTISEKVVKEYIRNPEYRKLFNFDKKLEELILIDPGYKTPIPICRYDMFYKNPKDFMFVEFNTDGTSAMNEELLVGKEIESSLAMETFKNNYKVKNINTFLPWVDESLNIYRTVSDKKPNIAIVDILNVGTTADFLIFRDYYREKGYNCEICDPRDLTYKNGKLMWKDYSIDLVYRRFVALEFMKYYDEAKDFIAAYKDKAFVMLGSFRTHLLHTKLTFYILRHRDTLAFLNEEERTFIEKHIPFTDYLSEDALKELKNNKDDYIIKPFDGYQTSGVYTGVSLSQNEWEKVLDKAVKEEYIYQKFYKASPLKFINFSSPNKVSLEDYQGVVGLYIYNGNFVAPYTRIGQDSIIGGKHNYLVAPNIFVEEKSK